MKDSSFIIRNYVFKWIKCLYINLVYILILLDKVYR